MSNTIKNRQLKKLTQLLTLFVLIGLNAHAKKNNTLATVAPVIICPATASSPIKLAAKELRRYVYLRTGELLSISSTKKANAISLVIDPVLQQQEYRLKSSTMSLEIAGGSDIAVLYGAYDFVEKLGVRFYLHGDVVPEGRIPLRIPPLNETKKPLFQTRGILPFHDFPEGPDWWSSDDYNVVLSQLSKMRMNFIGMHNYSGELLLWHGLANDVSDDGTVKTTYPSKWFSSTGNNSWGYTPSPTSVYTGGAAELFESDTMSSDVMGTDGKNFERSGRLLGQVTNQAHHLGIKVCLGSESPVWIPDSVNEKMKSLTNPNPTKEVYKGIFTWLKKNASVDYYWLWTPENWIWQGNTPDQFAKTDKDIRTAIQALEEENNPFQLATCGWVIGPQQDRLAWDKILPAGAPIANISRLVGHAALDSGFSTVKNRPTWAIPWLENDPDMVAYQPWVKRMRYDATDALQKGCEGLIGIHWRTKILAANISALAQAGWDQSWNTNLLKTAYTNNKEELNRKMPVYDFYLDFSRAWFGDNIAADAARILEQSDGFGTAFDPVSPEFTATTEWKSGPGALRVIKESWNSIEKKNYAFVNEFIALRGKVKGVGNLERFNYWANTFLATRQMALLGCLRGELDSIVEKMSAEKDTPKKQQLADTALKLRNTLNREWEKIIQLEIATVSTSAELGTIANLEQHTRMYNQFLTVHDKTLKEVAGQQFSAITALSKNYTGNSRITVLTARTAVTKGEALLLKILAIDKAPIITVSVFIRSMGSKEKWRILPTICAARGIWEITVPAMSEDFEYYVVAQDANNKKIVWPSTAPTQSQTVIVTE